MMIKIIENSPFAKTIAGNALSTAQTEFWTWEKRIASEIIKAESIDAIITWVLFVAPTKLVSVSLPKFKSEFRQDIVPVISEMGCDLPFNGEANLKIISENNTNISKIIQHTLIEVAENRSRNLTQLFIDPNEPGIKSTNFIRFNANHPFIYIVRDNLNKSILLMGKVISPNFNNLSAEYKLK